MSPDAGIDWKVDHILEVTKKSVENLIIAVINEEHHIFKAKFYDQTEELFKYHIELEVRKQRHVSPSHLDRQYLNYFIILNFNNIKKSTYFGQP